MIRNKENLYFDDLNAPVPGHSLTTAPGKWPWENPPSSADPEQVFNNDDKEREADDTEMLDAMIMSTRIQDMSKKERKDEGLSLNEILNNLDIRKWTDKDGKN